MNFARNMFLYAAALVLAAGCSARAAEAVTIGFAQVGSESEWRNKFSESMKREARERGIDLVFADANNVPESQVAAVRSFIDRRVDAIIIAPVVVNGWDEVLKSAKAAKIPVFIADRAVDSDPSLYVTRIAANFNLEGKLAGAWLAQASRGQCQIVELQGTPGSAAALERKRGFASVISLFPGLKITSSHDGDFLKQRGRQIVEQLIGSPRGLKDVCGIFAHNDDMMLGAIEAMKEKGLQPGKDLLTISVDAQSEALAAVRSGDLDASVELKSDIGANIYDVVLGYLDGRTDYPKWVVIPSDLITSANVDRHK
ncbi:MAG TPA: ABC transporter substrate-binding protein [Bradyrhizobium sp.]|nr:ABC transporter substrate-binding protein [Bradyrhizobium sp.]